MTMNKNGICCNADLGEGGSTFCIYHSLKGEVMYPMAFCIIPIVVVPVEIEFHIGVLVYKGKKLGTVP